MRRVIPFKKKETVDELLSQVLAVPRTGGLEPDPAIRNAVVAQMPARDRGGFNVLRSLRFSGYQMAFAMGVVLFAVLGIRKLQPDPPAVQPAMSPAAVMDTSRTDSPRVSFSDTLSHSSSVDSL